MENKPIYW